MTSWLLLTATLPTSPSALRVRIWRALKATGCGTLRDGVYVLPESAGSAADFLAIEGTIQAAGAEAHLMVLSARDDAQDKTFRALFDRAELHAELLLALKEARATLRHATEPELRKTLRSLEQQAAQVQAIDFFPGRPSERAAAALRTLRAEIELKLSPGEPTPRATAIERQSAKAYRGRTWATRKRPWIDRLGTAWLVRRYVDPRARFTWIDSAADCPADAVGFDFDGATFSHVEDQVTFEVVLHTFVDPATPGLLRLAELVHFIDVGGIPVDAAAGVETIVRGLQAQYPDDGDLLKAALPVFDALLAAMQVAP